MPWRLDRDGHVCRDLDAGGLLHRRTLRLEEPVPSGTSIIAHHLAVPALLAAERRVPSVVRIQQINQHCVGKVDAKHTAGVPHEPVHEDVGVPGQPLAAEGAGVHGVSAGLLAALERLDVEERRGGSSHPFQGSS